MIIEEDIVYAVPDGEALLARLYRRREPAPQPAIVSVHGGAWTRNDRTTAHRLDRALAAIGLAVLAIDFRQGPDFKYPSASQDINAAVRFLRSSRARLAVRTDRLGIIGSSSGGQLALLAGIQPHVPAFRGTPAAGADGQPLTGGETNASVDYVVALWPVSDPLGRYRYAREAGLDALADAHFNYYRDEAEMGTASIQRCLDEGEAQSLPPVWVAQPGNDSNVPQSMTLELLRAYQARGGAIEYAFYPGQPHAFIYEDTPQARCCIEAVQGFITRQLAQALG